MDAEPPPSSALAFLMTDIVGSTDLWERFPIEMESALPMHDALIDRVVQGAGGIVLKNRGEGDSTFSMFLAPRAALLAAIVLQREIKQMPWPPQASLRLRAGLHYGEAILRDGDYFGRTINRCARIRGAANGGQTLTSESFKSAIGPQTPEGVRFKDLGLHRLRDLQRPERLYEVADAQLGEELPAPRTLTLLPNNLPLQPTTFIGRDRDIQELKSLLARSRLVTVLGAGGSGKSRLAIQVAADEADKFPAGIWFVGLSGLAPDISPDLLVSTTLGRLDGSQDMSLRTFVDSLGGERCLLILDNCEHLLDAARSMVSPLLEAAPQLTIMTTSRQALGLDAERPYHLQPLTLPPKGADLPAMRDSDAVHLFIDRVQARDPSFELSERNAAFVRDLVLAVDGLPLAIEFVASHMRSIGPKQILSRLGEYLKPRYADPGQDPRHQTMESAIRWSYGTLTPCEQQVYHQASVFPDGFVFDAAEEICKQGPEPECDVSSCIAHLVDKSLLNADEDPFGDRRYRMLEPFREFARSELGEAAAPTKAAYIHWYMQLARSAEQHIETDQQARWLERLDTEADNLRMALQWTEDGARSKLGGFVYALRDYWTRRGNLREAVEWHLRALSSSPPGSLETAQLLNSTGALYWKLGDLGQAERKYAECLELGMELEDPLFMAKVRNNIAMLQDLAGRSDEAKESYLQNLELFRRLKDRPNEATTLSNLGSLDAKAGNWEIAVGELLEALAIFEELGNVAKIARVRCNLAEAYYLAGKRSFALGHLGSSFECWQTVIDPHFMGEGALLLGVICHDLGQAEDSLYLLLASDAVLRRCAASLGHDEAERQRAVLKDLRLKVPGSRYDRIRREALGASNESIVLKALGVCSHLQTLSAEIKSQNPATTA